MRSLILAASLLVSSSALAVAQTNPPGPPAINSPASPTTTRPTVGEAPVGHRQPRAGDIPQESKTSGDPRDIDPQEAALDRKIRGICRGC